MKYIILTLLMAPILSHSQLFNRFWPKQVVEKMNANPQQMTAIFDDDTLFYYQSTENGAIFYNLRIQNRLTRLENDTFKIDYYRKDVNSIIEKPSYTNYFTPDSTRYLYISKNENQLDSMVFYSNGKIKYRCSINDSSQWIFQGDSTDQNTVSQTTFNNQVISKDVKRDTLVYGKPGKLSYKILHGDTQSYHLADNKGRVYTSINGYRKTTSKVTDSDTTIFYLINEDTVRIDNFRKDSSISRLNITSSSYNLSVLDYSTQTNVLTHYYQGNKTSEQVTKTKGVNVKSVTYKYHKGKEYLSRKEEKTPFLRTVETFNEKGKRIDKSISEWDGNGGLIKTITWANGKKTVHYPKDFIAPGPRCGMSRLPVLENYRPQIDSVKVIQNGDTINQVYYNLLFIKVDNQWLDLEMFETYLFKNYSEIKDPILHPFKLVFETSNENFNFAYDGPFNWRKLFGSTKKPEIGMYNNLLYSNKDKVQDTQIILYISLNPNVRSINKFIDNASL